MYIMLNVAKYNGSSWQEWHVIKAIHDTKWKKSVKTVSKQGGMSKSVANYGVDSMLVAPIDRTKTAWALPSE